MKKITLLLILFLIGLNTFSQNWQIDWQQCYGGSENDFATDIIQIDDGYFVVGATSSIDGDVTNNDGGGEGWLVRIDSTGNLLWEKTYGGTDGERFVRIHESSSNSYYLVGASGSSNGDVSYNPYPNSINFWIVKIDSAGAIIWDKVVGGHGGDHIFNAIHTNDDGVIAIGYTNSDDGDISVYYGQYDMWMIKLNSEGESEWEFTIGNSAMDYPGAIIETSDGGYLVGGSSEIIGGGNLTCETNGLADAVIVKLDSLRNIEWQQCYGGSYYDGALELLETADGYLFAGYAGSNDGNISGWHGEMDIWLVQLDFFGNIIWQKCLGGGYDESPKYLYQNEEGDYIIVGVTSSNNGDVSGNHSLSYLDSDIWMVKVTETGEVIWQQCFGGHENEILHSGVLKVSENNYLIAGETNHVSGDVLCNLHSWKNDYWVFEISMQDTTTVTNPYNELGFRVYPNPAREYVIFEIQDTRYKMQDAWIILVNAFGQEVTRKVVTSKKTIFDLRGIEIGIYFYSLEIDRKVLCGKIVVQD